MKDPGNFRRQFTSMMEKLLHNAVSETFQLFESSVQELKAEIVQVKKDYDGMKDKLNISDDTRSYLYLGNVSNLTTKDNLRKCDIGVQCAGPTLVDSSCSPCFQNQDNKSTLQDLCPSLSEEENRRLTLVLIKQEALDLDDHTSGFFLLKQEDGEPKLVRKQPIKDIPQEVFVSSGVHRKTTFNQSSESTPSLTRRDVEDDSSPVPTIRNTEVRNDESESSEANEKRLSLIKKATFSAPTPAMEKQAVTSPQSQTVSTDSPALHFSQIPNEDLACSIGQSQSKIHLSLHPDSKTSFSLLRKATFIAPTPAMEKQAVTSFQSQTVCIDSPALHFSQANEDSVGQSRSKIYSVLQPVSILPPKSATPSQVSHFPAEFPGLLSELRSNQVARITNPSPASHTISQGQVQYQQIEMQVSRQQAPPFQGLPQTSEFPNSQPDIIVSASQILFSAGISQPVFSPLQPCCKPVSSNLPIPPTLHTVQSQAHSNHWPPIQEQITTQTQVLAPTMHFPGPVMPHGQPNTGKHSQTQPRFTHMLTSPLPPFASFRNITKSPSVIANMPSSPYLQASADTTGILPGPLPQASPPILSSVAPLPHNPSSFQGQSNTPAVSLQLGASPCPVSSLMHLGPSTTYSAPCSVSPHMHPVTHLSSFPPCPVQSMPSFPVEHHPSDPSDHMLLSNLLPSSTPALMPVTTPSVSADQCLNPDPIHSSPPVHSAPVSCQPSTETPEVPLSYPLQSFFEYLDPVHDLEEEPTSTMVHTPNTMAEHALSEHVSSASSQQCVPLTQLGTLHQPPSVTPDQLKEDPKDVDKEMKKISLAKTDKIPSWKKNTKCEVCGRVLSTAFALADHLKTHTGEKPFSCDQCGKAFGTMRVLKRHVQTHTKEKRYRCPECDKTFVYQSSLLKHQRLHIGKKPFACTVLDCDKRFFNKSDRKIHMRIHTEERPFSCMQCGKKFKHRLALKYHEELHTGEKRHHCPICDKAFVGLSAVKRHRLVHTGEKPYECPVCGKKFTQSGHMKNHVKSQHNNAK
ncbi:hypothetical protein ACEWY4_006588 [Coilia grayii]|uniref:C2H2-type domain-containing protein n=1 Tax=Coilia grayii TaxID=363190 RepID=A0ABD1KED5_9TELE